MLFFHGDSCRQGSGELYQGVADSAANSITRQQGEKALMRQSQAARDRFTTGAAEAAVTARVDRVMVGFSNEREKRAGLFVYGKASGREKRVGAAVPRDADAVE